MSGTWILALALWLGGIGHAQEPAPASPVAPRVGGPDIPQAEALRSSDGNFTLVVVAPVAWTAAEVQVAGTDAVDLGPAALADEVRVSGWTSKSGPLYVTLRVATPERVGVTWQFWVDAQHVPSRSPALERTDQGRSRKKRRSGK